MFADGPGGPEHFALFPLGVFGGLGLCAVIGAVSGGWLKGTLYRPEQPWRPTVRRETSGCAFVGAGFLGWGLGGVAGMVLTMLLSDSVPHWAIPIVFFSPPVLGLLAGGFMAHWIASLRNRP
jgi:hypothetical protein